MKVSPQEMLKRTTAWAKNIDNAGRASVAVGLPSEKVGGEVYGNGETVISVGAAHEYGAGVPRRSFLRAPFQINKGIMDAAIADQFRAVAEKGRPVDKALGLVGFTATNIVSDAFVTRGFGTWPDISQLTKDIKGSSQVLIDTGTLRNSITFVVRS